MEIEQCAQFIKDYGLLQSELQASKKEQVKMEIRRSGGDDLREARQELDRLKSKVGEHELGQVSSKLDLTEQLAEASDKARDLGRKNMALERRLAEVESILIEKDREREEA